MTLHRTVHNFLVFIILFILTSCGSKDKTPAVSSVDVTDFIVEQKTIPAEFNFVGFAASSHPVEIRAKVEGYLEKIAYDEGQLVHIGDLLFQLDPQQYAATVAQARGEVSRQEALLVNAKLTVDRLTPLYQQKAASKKDLDNATANQLANAAALQSAQASLLGAEINLGYTTITSPITGLTDRSKYREGALINPGSNSLMTTVSIIDPIWVYFNISDTDILKVQQQESLKTITLPSPEDSLTVPLENDWIAQAILSDGTVYPTMGKINYSSPTYDQSTGTISVRAVFENPDGIIRPGQFVRIKLFGAQRPHAIVVPQRALMQKKDGMFVYLIKNDNKVIAQDVATGDWFGEFQIITNGLKPGDKIVADGINKIRTGSVVKVIDHWKPSPVKTPQSIKPASQ